MAQVLRSLPDLNKTKMFLFGRSLRGMVAIHLASGLSDQLIPAVMMKQLYELSPQRTKRLAIFPEGTHNDTWQCQGYFTALEQFIQQVMKSHSPEEMAKRSRISNVEISLYKTESS
uniref:Uncharacterized protein n=1 Tax=Oryctolagus cuniculus TaxID=9986 RepID=A0A5F9CTJ1_RABIT